MTDTTFRLVVFFHIMSCHVMMSRYSIFDGVRARTDTWRRCRRAIISENWLWWRRSRAPPPSPPPHPPSLSQNYTFKPLKDYWVNIQSLWSTHQWEFQRLSSSLILKICWWWSSIPWSWEMNNFFLLLSFCSFRPLYEYHEKKRSTIQQTIERNFLQVTSHPRLVFISRTS